MVKTREMQRICSEKEREKGVAVGVKREKVVP
jgi:hypothetical protein